METLQHHSISSPLLEQLKYHTAEITKEPHTNPTNHPNPPLFGSLTVAPLTTFTPFTTTTNRPMEPTPLHRSNAVIMERIQFKSLNFPPGLMDEMLRQLLSFPTEYEHLIYGWAKQFASSCPPQDLGIDELVGTITEINVGHDCFFLNCKHGRGVIIDDVLFLLRHLPFSHNLTKINLDINLPASFHSDLIELLANPLLQPLVSLNVKYNARGSFVQNDIENLFSPVQSNDVDNHNNSPPFQLQKLSIKCDDSTVTWPSKHFSQSPQLANLKELDLFICNLDLKALFDDENSVLRNLEVLKLNLSTFPTDVLMSSPEFAKFRKSPADFFKDSDLNGIWSLVPHSPLDIAQCKLLSNLKSLSLTSTSYLFELHKAEWTILASSPYLWSNPNLKHLSLSYFKYLHVGFGTIIKHLEDANVRLESLELDGSSLSWDDLELLTRSPILSQIKSLSLFGVIIQPQSPDQDDDRLVRDDGDDDDDDDDDDGDNTPYDIFFKALAQSPNISQLQVLSLALSHDEGDSGCNPKVLQSFLQSPMLSNNLIDLTIGDNTGMTSSVASTLATERINPDDPDSPLKYGQVERLDLRFTKIGWNDVDLIEKNLQLSKFLYNFHKDRIF